MNWYRVAKIIIVQVSAIIAILCYILATTADPKSPGYVEPAVAFMLELTQFLVGLIPMMIIDDMAEKAGYGYFNDKHPTVFITLGLLGTEGARA